MHISIEGYNCLFQEIPLYGAIVVAGEVDGGLGSASGGSVIHCSSDTTLNLMSSIAIHRGLISPISASIVIYKFVLQNVLHNSFTGKIYSK